MWPRNVAATPCGKCTKRLPVIQTAYGARATCVACGIRWTSLFSEEGMWVDEPYSHLSDNNSLE